MDRIIECVPNFSEGRNTEKIEKILDVFRGKKESSFLTIQAMKTTTVQW